MELIVLCLIAGFLMLCGVAIWPAWPKSRTAPGVVKVSDSDLLFVEGTLSQRDLIYRLWVSSQRYPLVTDEVLLEAHEFNVCLMAAQLEMEQENLRHAMQHRYNYSSAVGLVVHAQRRLDAALKARRAVEAQVQTVAA